MINYLRLLVCFSIFLVCNLSSIPAVATEAPRENTLVTPHLETPITAGQNTLFCSTFQIAWSQMRDEIIKEDIQLEKPLDLVRYLNHGLSTEDDLPGNDYLAMAGYGKDRIVDTINRALKKKFGPAAPEVDTAFNRDDVILAYAFLFKELDFTHDFEAFEHPASFYDRNGLTLIEAFGVSHYSDARHRKLKDQVDILHYSHMREAIVRLKSSHPDDEIILASVEPESTLLETFNKVNRQIKQCEQTLYLGEKDVLQIPKLDLSIEHRYESLIELSLLNKGFEKWFITEARQDIRFRLDECGATLKSQAVFALKKCSAPNYKILVFNKPFLLYLKKKDGAYPYFAMWVENPEFMVKCN